MERRIKKRIQRKNMGKTIRHKTYRSNTVINKAVKDELRRKLRRNKLSKESRKIIADRWNYD